MEIREGRKHHSEYVVKEEHSAKAMGSGSVEVLSTPSLAAFMEGNCRDSLQDMLPEGSMTVGTSIEIDHLKASKIGAVILIESEVTGIDGRLVHFRISAVDSGHLIGQAAHTRAIVDVARFMAGLNKKA